jgi:hypothetical protein
MAAPSGKFTLVVGRDLETGRVRVATAAMPSEKREAEDDEPREADETAMTSEAIRIDLRARLDWPWRPTRLKAALILRELISDDMEIELDLTAGAYKDPAVEKHRLEEAAKAPLPDVAPALKPGKPVPAYGKVEGAPEVPEKAGLLLSGPRVVKLHSAGPLTVLGSFRAVVPESLLVAGERGKKAAEQSGGKDPGALVPVTLVITGSSQPAPMVFNLIVPSFEVDPKSRMAAGSFAVDLEAAGPLRKVERTLFVYGFAGAERFGPLPIALVGD